MNLSGHFSFHGAEDDWFFAPVVKHCANADKPLAMVEHSLREGEWDLKALLADFPDVEVLRRYENVESDGTELNLKRMLLKLGEDRGFVLWDRPGMYVLATEADAARRIMDQLASRFYKPKRHRNKPTFHIVCQEYGETASTAVPVKRAFLRKVADFEFHYGEGFMAFHEHLVERMKRVRQGIAVLRGEPGTGKTTYIRALIWQLRRSHRFYTIPLQEFARMTASDLTSFWIDEKKKCERQNIVLVIEDAEDLIRGDGHERPPQIATLLNLSDGLIGELLEFQIIVTVNCPLEDIDPAITRKGRLMAYHEFRRLTQDESARVAAHHGLELPRGNSHEGWCLAEIFNLGETAGYGPRASSRMGFHAP